MTTQMGDINLESTEMRCELATSAGQNSPVCSTQSSPSSSNISESEIDISSLSRHSSCSSLNQQNMLSLSTTTTRAITSSPFSIETYTGRNSLRTFNNGRFDRESTARTHPGSIPDNASDDDATAEDSNNSFGARFRFERRNTVEQSGITWRSPNDNIASGNETERRTTLPRPFTPSPSVSGRSSPACVPIPSHSRVANIRRESSCSIENELAHERMMQIAQQVSSGFDEFTIGSSIERKRTHSLSEPISVQTNAFGPQSCSPSPTRAVDIQKQCYSPSTQQVVRNNIPYSPSQSPTPSPTRHTMRSLSPIAVRQVTKRRFTSSSGGELDFDHRTAGATLAKRVCQQPFMLTRGCVSPLAMENLVGTLDSTTKSSELTSSFPLRTQPRLLVDPLIEVKMPPTAMELDEDGDSVSDQRTSSAASEELSETGEAGSLKKDG